MANVTFNRWKREHTTNRESIIRFQIIIHCHLEKVSLSPAELDCLTMIGMGGKVVLKPFAIEMGKLGIFANEGSARNSITRMMDKGLVIKEGRYEKTIYLNPAMKIQTTGSIKADCQLYYIDRATIDQDNKENQNGVKEDEDNVS